MPTFKQGTQKVFITPTAADVIKTGLNVAITDVSEDINSARIDTFTRTLTAAGTASAKTYDFNLMAAITDSEYVFKLTHNNVTRTYVYRATAAADTKTTVRAGILAAILRDPDRVVEDNTSATTDLKLIMKTTDAVLEGGDTSFSFSDSAVTVAVNTPYVAPAGTSSIVNAAVGGSAGSADTFTTYEIDLRVFRGNNVLAGQEAVSPTRVTVYAEDGAVGYAAFDVAMVGIFNNTLDIASQDTATRTGAGALDVTKSMHLIVTDGADALTLADGAEGQSMYIVMKTDAGAGTLTPTNLANGSTVTFDDVGDSATLTFMDGSWVFMGGTATLA